MALPTPCIKDPPEAWGNIPQELKDRPQWVLWRKEIRNGKPTKAPYQINGRRANHSKPETWNSYENVVAAYQTGFFDGIGYVFSADDPFTGNDFDHCIDPETGEIKEPAKTYIHRLNTYSEKSPSGFGVHTICRAQLPDGRGRKDQKLGFEVYDRLRFFTISGIPVDGCSLIIEDRQNEIDAFYKEVFDKSPSKTSPVTSIISIEVSDSDLIERAMRAKNGEKFKSLWNGSYEGAGFKSQSEGDMSLCAELAFYTRKDPSRIDRLFRKSALMRDKWDEKHGEETYGQMTISRAIEKTDKVYEGKGFKKQTHGLKLIKGAGSETSSKITDIIVTSRQLREISDDSLSALEAANNFDGQNLYIRSGMLTTLREDEKGSPKIQLVNETILRGRLTRAANFYKVKNDGNYTDIPPPIDVTRDILELGRWPFPPLIGVIESPVIRPDGSILNYQGYDPVTKLYYKTKQGLIIPEIPANPTIKDVSRARLLIEELIIDFPFTNQASRAGIIAFFLTPLLRSAFPGCTPLAVIDAPEAGTGKTLLAKLCCLIHTGEEGQMMTPPATEEEWRKFIATLLLSGENIVVIDNVNFPLQSSSLASVLTATGWKDRLLGTNELISIPHLATWACNGNNLKVKGDLKRRCYHIRLDPKQARPWERNGFKHPNILGWARDHRGDLLWSLLIMARSWYAAGRPKSDVQRLGSFEDWAEIIGGILAFSGIEGFLSNLDSFYDEQDEEYQEWSIFFSKWFEILGENQTTTKELLAKIPSEVLPGDFDGFKDDTTGSLPRKLGNCLSKRADRIFEGFRLEKTKGDSHNKVSVWKLINLRGLVE